jgi:hypothetical protein
VVLLAVILIALGETSGALLSELRPSVQRYARGRVVANAGTHGLVGSAEYDTEVTNRAVFASEAGLSFFHTHAEGLGLLVLFVSTVGATAVPWRLTRGAIHVLVAIGGLFPLGYLVFGMAVLERGLDDGIALAERWVLTPLGSTALAGVALLGVAVSVRLARRRAP